jgi:hypothetical protein
MNGKRALATGAAALTAAALLAGCAPAAARVAAPTARLDSEFVRDIRNSWPYDQASCSLHGAVSGEVPVVAGSGTGGYRGIAGTFTVSITLDEVGQRTPACDAGTPFLAQLILIAGTGSVRP